MMFISRLYSSVVVCNSSGSRLLPVCNRLLLVCSRLLPVCTCLSRLSLGGSFRIDPCPNNHLVKEDIATMVTTKWPYTQKFKD